MTTAVGPLLDELMSRSGVLWIDTGERSYAAWFAWVREPADDPRRGPAAYVVNGPGEQHLPWLPDQVSVVVRDPATGGRVLRLRALCQVLAPGEPEWEGAAAALAARRQGAPGDVVARWRDTATITAIRPFGPPLPDGGERDPGSG